MNICVLDNDIEHCAQYHCDQHVIKMILESIQILCTALNKKGFVTPYRSTHIHHPCVLWVEASFDNFLWLKKLAQALNQEYRYRYDKQDDHKSIAALETLEDDKYEYERLGLTEFTQAMPDQYKVVGNPIKAYRQFYLGDKMHFAKWSKRPVPHWITRPS